MADQNGAPDQTPDEHTMPALSSQAAEKLDDETLKEQITGAWCRLTHDTCEILEQLIKYAIQAFASVVLFALFVLASIGADWLCKIWPGISIMIMIKVIAWIISTLGAFCCIALVFRNTIAFIKFLSKGPPQETSVQSVGGERRNK